MAKENDPDQAHPPHILPITSFLGLGPCTYTIHINNQNYWGQSGHIPPSQARIKGDLQDDMITYKAEYRVCLSDTLI